MIRRVRLVNSRAMRNESDYDVALAEIDRLTAVDPVTPESDRLEVLVTLVERYDSEHWVIDAPNRCVPLRHPLLQPPLPPRPIRHDPVQQPVERRPVMRLRHVAEFMRDHVVDRVDRGFDEPAVEQQPPRR